MYVDLRVPFETPSGVPVGSRHFVAGISDGTSFIVYDRNEREAARGDIVGGIPVVLRSEHDSPSLRGIPMPAATFARALVVALERARKGAA